MKRYSQICVSLLLFIRSPHIFVDTGTEMGKKWTIAIVFFVQMRTPSSSCYVMCVISIPGYTLIVTSSILMWTNHFDYYTSALVFNRLYRAMPSQTMPCKRRTIELWIFVVYAVILLWFGKHINDKPGFFVRLDYEESTIAHRDFALAK